jgi:hypothetical protein
VADSYDAAAGGIIDCDASGGWCINRAHINKLGIFQMTAKQIAILLAAVLFAGTAYSGDKHHKMEIKVVEDDGDGETSVVIDSDDMGFKLHDLAVGETRNFVDKEGRPIEISRGDDGFSINVDGKTIDLPGIDKLHRVKGGHGKRKVIIGDGEHAVDMDVRVIRAGGPHIEMMDGEGVMIFSAKEIDEATKQIIRTALESTGHEKVHFADGDEGGLHEVHVIKEVVKASD